MSDVLVDHFLSELRRPIHHAHSLGRQLLLQSHDLRVHFNCKPAKLGARDLIRLGLNCGLRDLCLVARSDFVPVLSVLLVVEVFTPLD